MEPEGWGGGVERVSYLQEFRADPQGLRLASLQGVVPPHDFEFAGFVVQFAGVIWRKSAARHNSVEQPMVQWCDLKIPYVSSHVAGALAGRCVLHFRRDQRLGFEMKKWNKHGTNDLASIHDLIA